MNGYNDHVKAIADHVEKIIIAESSENYDAFEDNDIVYQVICGETEIYGKTKGWYGSCKNYYDMDCEGLLFAAAQMIAGASPNIELSFNGQYRKDMFRDVAINALYQDIFLNLKERHQNIEDVDFCYRG